MDDPLKELNATLAEWQQNRTWGSIEVEVQRGQIVLLRRETKKKFDNGGFQREPERPERSR